MARRTEVMLEEIRGMLKALGEGFAGHTEAINDLRERMGRLEEKEDVAAAQIIALKHGQDAMRQDLTSVKEDVAVLKQDMAGVKQDVAVLKQDVAVLKHDVAGVKVEVSAVRQDLKEGLAHLGDRWLEHDRDISSLKRK